MGLPQGPTASGQAWIELLHAEIGYLLGQSGIRALHIKGPTVALWLYPPGERPWGDVDILVSPTQMDDALTVLRDHGFTETFRGVDRDASTDHAVCLRRADPARGADEIDVHERFPGIEADPALGFDLLWARRQPARLAHIDTWFPDLPTRAILTVLNTARTSDSEQARRDLTRLLEAGHPLDWVEVVALARDIRALPALRAGLELAASGRAIIATTELRDVPVSREWKLRLAGAPRTALRLDELARLSMGQRALAIRDWLFPAPAILRMRAGRDSGGPVWLIRAYLRRIGDGVRSVPSALQQLRQHRGP